MNMNCATWNCEKKIMNFTLGNKSCPKIGFPYLEIGLKPILLNLSKRILYTIFPTTFIMKTTHNTYFTGLGLVQVTVVP